MATTLKHVELPTPVRGMNTDTSPSQVNLDQAPYIKNLVISEPGQFRTRAGWVQPVSYVGAYGGTGEEDADIHGAVPYHFTGAVPDVSVLINVVSGTDGDPMAGGGNPRIVEYSGTSTSVVTPNASRFESQRPIGQYVEYAGVTYFVAQDFTSKVLAQWAGGDEADITSGGITISNGAKTGTLSSSVSSAQLSDRFLIVTGGATGPLSGYRYAYHIRSGTGTDITLHEPYGYGLSTSVIPNAVGASTTLSIRALTEVPECPREITSVGLFRERVFTTGGYIDNTETSLSDSVLKWSQVGNPQIWPASNYILIGDENDELVALGNVPEGLLVFSRNKTWLLTGYDEDSFTVRQLSGSVGCESSTSVHYANGVCYWMAEDGIYMSAGGAPQSLTQPAPGVGIKSFYLGKMWRGTSRNLASPQPNRKGSISIAGDYLLASITTCDSGGSRGNTLLACDMRTGGWVEWGSPDATAVSYNPGLFVRRGTQTLGFGVWNAVNVTDCFAPERFITDNAREFDANLNDAGAADNDLIEAEVRFADVRLAPAETTRVQGFQIEHNCHYVTGSPRVAWSVTLDVDSSIDASALTVGSVHARLESSGDRLDKYYVDRFMDSSFPTEGAVFRVRMVKSAQTVSAKVFRVFLVTDGQATFDGRVDNATT